MIHFTTATNGKTTKSVKNPTSTSGKTSILKFLCAFALVMLLGVNGVMGQVTIASQDFESSPATPTLTFTTSDIGTPGSSSGTSSGVTGASVSNAPSGVNMYVGGSQGYRLQGPSSGSANTGRIFTFSSVNTTSYSSIQASFRVAGMSLGSNGNGMDNTTGTTILGSSTPIDFALIEVSPDGGTTWYQQGVVSATGGTNVKWSFGATGSGSKAYAANNTYSSFNTTGTGTITSGTTAITTATITSLPSVSNLRIRITLQCNSANESWIIDDVIITGTAAATPSIAISNGSIAAGTPNNGQTNVVLQRYDMAVTSADATLTGLTVTTAGTYAAADLTNLKCWYQTSTTFNAGTATLLSTKTTALGAGSQAFPTFSSQSLVSGSTYYIFVTADIASGATNGNTINIASTAFSNITFSSGTKTGTDPVAAAGVQTITVAVPDIALSSPAASAANITVGTTNNVVYRFDLAITTATPSLTGVTINTSTGSNVSGDLTNLKCWYQTSTTFNAGTATLLSTKTTSLAAGSQVFPTFSSQSLTTGSTYYIFITADVPLTATINNTVIVSAITTSDLTFATGNKTGTANASGTKTIIDCTPADVTGAAASSANQSSVLTWVNPSCYDEILIVAALASNTGTPTGNGSAYSGNLAYGSGTALGNGFVVYKVSTSGQTVTGLTNGTQYFFKYFTRRGTTWTSGTEVNATPNIAGYYWNGASIAASPAAGGTGTWGTANSWRQPSSTGAQATWVDGSAAVFEGTAGTVTLEANRTVTTCFFNTTNYVLTPDALTTRVITGSTSLSSNVVLNINDIAATSNRTLNFSGNVGGASGSSLNVNVNQLAGNTSRINLGAAGATLSIPITVTAGANNVTYGNMAVVGTSNGTILTSAATITNNTNYSSGLGATSANDLTANGVISGSAGLMFAAGSSGGAGTITLNVANTYTGATIFNAATSGVIRLGIANALPTGTNVTMANSSSNGGIFDLNGFNQTIASLTSGAGGGSIRNNGATDATLTISGSTSPAAFALAITDGSTNKTLLTKAGTGTLTLSGTNTYTGATTINEGTLQLAVGNVGSVGAITSSPIGTGTLNLNGGTLSSNSTTARTVLNATSIGGDVTLGDATNTGALSFSAATTISGATRTLTTASAVTFTGVIGDGGNAYGITKAGASTLTLSGANTYSGATTISAGTLQLAGGNVGSVGSITSSPIGTSTLNLNGGTLSSSNTTARTILNATSIGGNITLGDATNTGALTFDAATTISGATRTLTTASAVTFAGAIGDGGNAYGITKAGTGTLSLTATNTYTGLTTISSGGILQLNRTGGTTIPVTNNATISGGTLKISTNQTLNNVTLTSGTLMVDAGVTLTINGSFTGGGTIENNGTIVLVGPSSFPGATTTISAMNNLAIDRASNVTLDQSITITGNLTLTNGKLITGACNSTTSNVALTMADNATITGSSSVRFVDGILKKTGNDAFTFPIGSGAKYAPVSISAPSVSTDRFAACYTGSNPNSSYSITSKAGSLNNVSKMEYWHINREVGTSSANVTLSWDTIARSGPVRDMTLLRVCHWNSSSSQWTDLGQTGTTGSNASGTITSGSVTSFSPFTLGSSGSANPLPVTWAYFTAQKTDGGNQLDWGTASEKNTSHFEIEYSVDGSNFIAMNDKINAAGNSAHLLEYRCIHKLSPPLIYYRIKQIDLDGLYDYSKTIILKNKDVTSKNFIKVLPSYVQGQEPLTIQGYESNMPFVFYEIINGQGQRILSDKISTIDGYFHHSLSLEMYPTGLYYLRVFNSDLDNIYQGKIRK
jgi:autotransporter-associated beta strand protein